MCVCSAIASFGVSTQYCLEVPNSDVMFDFETSTTTTPRSLLAHNQRRMHPIGNWLPFALRDYTCSKKQNDSLAVCRCPRRLCRVGVACLLCNAHTWTPPRPRALPWTNCCPPHYSALPNPNLMFRSSTEGPLAKKTSKFPLALDVCVLLINMYMQ